MPFGWVGCDALKKAELITALVERLQCLSAGLAVKPSPTTSTTSMRCMSLQCLSAGLAVMPKNVGEELKAQAKESPMPFGWVGCDAFKPWTDHLNFGYRSPMPFGWVGCDARNP